SPVHRFSGGWIFASRRLGSGISSAAVERACQGLLYSVCDSGAGVAFLLFPLEFAVFLVMLVTLLGDDEQANGGEDVFQHRWLLRGMRGAAAQAFQRLALAPPRQPGRPRRGRAHDQVAIAAVGAAGEEVLRRDHVVGGRGGLAPAAARAVESQWRGADRHASLLGGEPGDSRSGRRDGSCRTPVDHGVMTSLVLSRIESGF